MDVDIEVDLNKVPKGNYINMILKLLKIMFYLKGLRYKNKILDKKENILNVCLLNKIDRIKEQLENDIDSDCYTNDLMDIIGYAVFKLVKKSIKNPDEFRKDVLKSIKD